LLIYYFKAKCGLDLVTLCFKRKKICSLLHVSIKLEVTGLTTSCYLQIQIKSSWWKLLSLSMIR